MTEVVLHSEPYGELLLLPEAPALLLRWHGFANSRNLRFLLNEGLGLYQHYLAHYPTLAWVSDCRRFGAVLPADQQWAATDWNHRAQAAGIRRVGLLPAENVFGQIALQQYTHNAAQGPAPLEITYYSSLEQACRGLRSGATLGGSNRQKATARS